MTKCYEHEECEYNAQPNCALPDGMRCPHEEERPSVKWRNCKHRSWAEEEPGKSFFGWCSKVLDCPDPDIERECRGFEMRTNADRIRAMDDGSLLDFFVELSGNVGCPPNGKGFCDEFDRYGRNACAKCWDNYLTSPAEEDTP